MNVETEIERVEVDEVHIYIDLTWEEAVKLRALCEIPAAIGDVVNEMSGYHETGYQAREFVRALGTAMDIGTVMPRSSLVLAFGGAN